MSKARRLARKRAIQALYSWHLNEINLSDIDEMFVLENDFTSVDIEYFRELLHQIPAHIDELDAVIAPLMSRKIDELDPIEHAVLRLAVYELKFRLDIPYKVVINEAVEIAKIYGASEAHKFVNGIIDKAAQQLRMSEIAYKRGPVE